MLVFLTAERQEEYNIPFCFIFILIYIILVLHCVFRLVDFCTFFRTIESSEIIYCSFAWFVIDLLILTQAGCTINK